MKQIIEFGYTITDCYSGNANFGSATQKQYVVSIDGELKNVFLKGFVNVTADDGRGREYFKICDLSTNQLAILMSISADHKTINWNTGQYSVFTNLLSKKDYRAIKEAEQAYIACLIEICEPINKAADLKARLSLKKFIIPLIPEEDREFLDRFIWIF